MADIEICNLTKRFGTNLVVDDISLTVNDKEFVTLLGPSGCGKTTILRMIAGFLQPDAGEIKVGGQLISSATYAVTPERRNMGMVFQNYAVWPHMTVTQNVAFGLEMKRIPKGQISVRIEGMLDMVGLAGLGGRYPAQLSGGQQQRVALARSLIVEPTILLLDEPLSNLDAKLREQMRFTIKDLQRRTGITFVYVTHDQAEAMAMSDRVAVIQHGKIQQFAPPRKVYEQPANHSVADFMGLVNLLKGNLAAVGTSSTRSTVRISETWSVGAYTAVGLTPGEDVTLVIRPEDISLLPASAKGSDSGLALGKVTARTYLGSVIDYRVEVEGQPLRVQSPHSMDFPVEARVAVKVDEERCLALRPSSPIRGGTT
jgi:iron(III) transport system ATP-binding protein